ncbi:cytochrome c biogenesis protein ResB [Microbacterium sp. NIBRBAC000506063]|uniref:cytochrome c biogenesis protein ResB n=1 Tax=Microbacterium sp. NIBRBAC000506063 TaxID=2734618 RepID=UPI001BB65912|nr:cytochrome c biogenesis protein ResB [Microbacterium sp. NIBRBAC000506063]QTV80105.1 cytochrome c biogenesis protein ResB [Microbacterium sp. NIBRBAC000506063]
MSSSPSDPQAGSGAAASDPLRPSDHVDGGSAIVQPRLGVTGWLRWGWRQLTSMRTALVLLLILAIAAIPGSLFPQRMADPNGVTQWRADNPDLFPVLDALDLFDVYMSPWFSAIYLLLFISLIGCVIPRIKHHAKALRAQPPRTPVRLARLDDHREVSRESENPDAAASAAVDTAETQLKSLGYRVARFDGRGTYSVSAERGYWRETGNLVFHLALVGVLVTVGVGGGYSYTGQQVIVEETTFVNTLLDYSSIQRGRFVTEEALEPYAITLDSFDVSYVPAGSPGAGQAGDFAANITVRDADGEVWSDAVRVNHPLPVAGDSIYLLGNGYAPTITVRNAEGTVIFRDDVPFLPQDSAMTSLGIVKIADGMPEQLGLQGFFYPTQAELATGAFTSVYPALVNPVLTLNVYEGDLGIDDGTPRSVYVLDTTDMTQLTGGDTGLESIELAPGESADLPNGLGMITFENASPDGSADYENSVKRYASLQIHHDRSAVWVLVFSLLALAGLLLALFVPRRRMWVKATPADGTITLEYAGLARGEDPTLAAAVDDLAAAHGSLLDAQAAASDTAASDTQKVG